ncbi:PAS domain S-box protein [Candidatus Woesearchaeota archaeon]|nr:PAS domain S-box protein [Candidatus Woesearchaeota archaeon]
MAKGKKQKENLGEGKGNDTKEDDGNGKKSKQAAQESGNSGGMLKTEALLNMLEDIRESKQKKAQSEKRYRSVLRNAGIAIAILEEDRTISLANKEFEKLSGYPKEKIEGKKRWTEFVAEKDLEKMKRYHEERREKKGKAPKRYEFEFVDRKGRKKNILLNIGMIPGTKKSVASISDITSLKESQEKFRKIFWNSADGIAIADPETRKFTDVNEAFCRYTGYSRKELLDMKLDRIHPKKKLPEVLKSFKKQAKGEMTLAQDIPVVRKDKKIVYADVNSIIITIKRNKRMLGTFRDITEEREAEQKLKEGEKKLRILFDKAPAAIYVMDLKGKFKDGNQKAEELTGYNKDELIGKSFLKLKLLTKSSLQKAAENLEKNKKGKATGPDHLVLIDKKEKKHHIEVVAHPCDMIGKKRVIGIARDITKRVKAEKEAEKNRKRYRRIVENTNDIIISFRTDGRIIYISPNVERYGYSTDDVEGHHVKEFVHADDRKKVVKDLEKTLKTGKMFPTVFRLMKKDKGYIWAEEWSNLVEEDGEKRLIGVIRDITERKKKKEELKEQENMFRKIVDNIREGVIVSDLKGNNLYVNSYLADKLGYKKEELKDKGMKDLVPKRYRKDMEKALERWKKELEERKTSPVPEKPYPLELMTRDGSKIGMDVYSHAVKWDERDAVLSFFRENGKEKD